MAWIESHTVLLRHRKLVALASSLKLKPVYVMGHLHALWHTALEQQDDGDLSSWTDETIASSASYSGGASQLVSLLQQHRWFGYFDERGKIIPGTEKLIHDWVDNAGKFLTGRYSSKNPDRLRQIWAKHRRRYGEKQPRSNREVGEHNHTNLPNPPTTGADGRGSVVGEVLPDGTFVGNEPSSRADAESKALSFARGWITVECDQFITRKGPALFAKLILRLGKDRAVDEVKAALKKPEIENPFAWLMKKYDSESAIAAAKPKAIRHNQVREVRGEA